MSNQYSRLALSDDDPRVRYEIRPSPETDGYEVIMTSSGGTQGFRVPYEVGDALLGCFRSEIEGVADGA